MDSNRLDLLAQETLKLSFHLQGKFNDSNFEEAYDRYTLKTKASELEGLNLQQEMSFLDEPIELDEHVLIPETSGLLFKLEQSVGTFCIRGVASEDLQYDWELLLKGDKRIVEALKLDGTALSEKLLGETIFYFKTDHFSQAEVIHDQLINRRFPIEEDVLCNLSDPGFSWWLELGHKKMTIYFKSHGLDRADRFIKLGPLGDSLLAQGRFQQLYPWFKSNLSLAEFTCTDKLFDIRVSEETSHIYKGLKAIFEYGSFDFKREDLPAGGRGATLYYYLSELSALRAFWITVESKLT